MKLFPALLVSAALLSRAQSLAPAGGADPNINSRYTVESVAIDHQSRYRVSSTVLEDMQRLVGTHFNTAVVERLANRIRREVHNHPVTFRLARGVEPDHVKVTFAIERPNSGFDITVPEFMYNSREGFSAAANAVVDAGDNRLTIGGIDDGDRLIERFAGVRARYDRLALGSDRVRFGIEFDSFHDRYRGSTESAAIQTQNSAALYRSRDAIEPTISFAITDSLTVSAGASFNQVDQTVSPAREIQSANAAIATVRLVQKWQSPDGASVNLEAGYSVRASSGLLGADYVYTRNAVDTRVRVRRGGQTFEASFLAGTIAGRAPLYDRFVIGNSEVLRGWSKYDIAPLGGNRLVYGSLGYGYGRLRVFYDTGAIWDAGTAPVARNSAGAGLKLEGMLFAVAFPLRDNRVEPVFIAGMSF